MTKDNSTITEQGIALLIQYGRLADLFSPAAYVGVD